MAKIFISYKSESHPDTQLAHVFHTHLKKAGLEPFVAEVDIRLGENWDKRIEQELKDCDYFILLMSENAIASEMVVEEVRRAKDLNKQSSTKKPLILPIHVKLPKNVQISYDLSGYLNKIQKRFWETDDDTTIILNEIISIATGKKVVTENLPVQNNNTPEVKNPFANHPVNLNIHDEKQQLRQHLSSFLVPPQLDQITEMLFYYITSANQVLIMFEQLSNQYNSAAGRAVVNELRIYLNNPNDLFPESQYGVYGKMDDAWIIHNTAYTLVQAGIVNAQYFGVDWNMLIAANQIVVQYLPQQVTIQLNTMMMNLLGIIAQETGNNFMASFTQTANNQYQPNMGNGQAVGYNENNLYQQLANGIAQIFS